MDTPTAFVASFAVSILNGDNTYQLDIWYRDEHDDPLPQKDSFSFTTAAKLKKFINKTLLAPTEEETEDVALLKILFSRSIFFRMKN